MLIRRLLPLLAACCTQLQAVAPHPRLFFPAGGEAVLKQRLENDPLARTLDQAIIRRAERVLTEPTVAYNIPDGLRLLEESRRAINRVLHSAYAWRMTGEQKYFDRCVKELDAACALPDWNPKHFLDVGEMATAVAIGYDWLYPQLTAEQRARYETALSTNAIDAANSKENSRFTNFWQKEARNNWTQVCFSGLMISADALFEKQPDLPQQPLFQRARLRIGECEKFYQPDGVYPEGVSYWHYGTTYQVLAMALMERDAPLKLDPCWVKTVNCLAHTTGPSGNVFNFADSNPGQAEVSPALSWLANRTGDALAIDYTRGLIEKRFNSARKPDDRFLPLTLVWLPKAKTAKPLDLCATFQGEQALASFRSDWSDQALWLAIKGGTPAISHAQMDVGSFVLDWAGTRWIHDLGRDNYNLPEFFGAKRFTYFRNQNFSHNTLSIGGQLQNEKAKPCPVSPITLDGATATATLDLTEAYRDQCQQATRSVVFDGGKKEILLTDRLFSPTGTVSWRVVTDAKISLNEATATLEKSGRQLELVSTKPTTGTWKITPATPPNDKENPNKGFQILSLETAATPDTTIQVRISAKGN